MNEVNVIAAVAKARGFHFEARRPSKGNRVEGWLTHPRGPFPALILITDKDWRWTERYPSRRTERRMDLLEAVIVAAEAQVKALGWEILGRDIR